MNHEATALAERAAQARKAGRHVEAAKLYREALKIAPDHGPAKEGFVALKRQAAIQYNLALNLRRTSPAKARDLLKSVLAVLPPEDPTYKKAEALAAQPW